MTFLEPVPDAVIGLVLLGLVAAALWLSARPRRPGPDRQMFVPADQFLDDLPA